MQTREEKDQNIWNTFQFPIVKNWPIHSISDQIEGKNCFQVQAAMREMFKKIEEETGYSVFVNGNQTPISSLIPDENVLKNDND